MSAKSWLETLKRTIEEESSAPSEELPKPEPGTPQNVRKPREVSAGEVVDLNAARSGGAVRVTDGSDERRLLAAGWRAKERMRLTIWANPETGLCCSREVALHRLANPLAVSPYRRLLEALGPGRPREKGEK